MKENEWTNLFYVKGYARPIDYIIRINVPFDFNAPDPSSDLDGFNMAKQDWISTLNHELVHYYQFMATAVGRRIVQLQKFIFGWQGMLLQHLPEEIYLPVLEWMGSEEINVPFNQWIEQNKPFRICIAHFKQSSLTSNFLSSA